MKRLRRPQTDRREIESKSLEVFSEPQNARKTRKVVDFASFVCSAVRKSSILSNYFFTGQNLCRAQIIAEILKVLEGPDDLLVARDFDQLWVLRSGMRITEDQVAVGQKFEGRHPGQRDAGQLF